MLDVDDLRDIPILEELLDGERMARMESAYAWSGRSTVCDIPLRAAESKAVWQLALESVPKGLPLLLGQLEQVVVESLELLVLLGEGRVISPVGAMATALSTASATAAASSVLSL